MAVLHLVNKTRALPSCLARVRPEDAIVLLEDGVYAGVALLAPERALHALEPDVVARGIGARLGANVRVITDADLVTLVETHQPVITWR